MKKIISLILSGILLTSAVSAAPAFGGASGGNTAAPVAPVTGSSDAESILGAPDFEDTFDFDSGAWDLGYDCRVSDGVLYAPEDKYAYCSTLYDQWQDFNMEFEFTIKKMSSVTTGNDFWFGPSIKSTTFMFNGRTMIQYNSKETGVQNGLTIPNALEDDVTYCVKIETTGKKATLYLKKKTETKYTKLGTLPTSQQSGKIGFESYPAGIAFDNVRVWDKTDRPFRFTKMSVIVNTGESAKLEVVNNSGDPITFESADPAIATVSEDGTVTAVSAGKVQIIAKNSTGYSTSVTAVINMPVTAINLCTYERELYVGESINFKATISPSNATNRNLVWRSSDENVISVVGDDSLYKGIKAEGTGTAELFVSTPDGSVDASCTFIITERPPLETGEAVFTMKGISHEIPKYKFGLSAGAGQNGIEHNMTREGYEAFDDMIVKMVDDIGFVHLKPFMNTYDPVAGWTNSGRERPEGVGPYYVKDFVEPVNHAGIPAVWDSAVNTYVTGGKPDIELYVKVLKEIKELTPGQPLYITCTPEAYAMHYEQWLPRIEDYVNLYKELSRRVKTEIDPDAKIAVTLCGPSLYRGVIADPNNWGRWENDMEYTQGARIATWHNTLAEDQSWFDAVDLHLYTTAHADVNITGDRFLHSTSRRIQYDSVTGLIEVTRLFPDKEIWCTEWNDFQWQFSYGLASEKGRAQTQKTVGSVVAVMQEFGEHMTNERMKISSYFYVWDAQGFGLMEGSLDDPVYLPYYYAVKAGGEVFGPKSGNTHAYPLSLASGKTLYDVFPMNSDKEAVNLQEVYAYGFGDENNVKEVMFTNPTYKNMRVKLTDATLRKDWCFKPKKADEPYPEFYVRDEAFNDFDPDSVPLPETYENGTFEEYIEIPPYSVVMATVESTAARADVPEKLSGALVLKANSSKAILPDGFLRGVDAVNPEVKPIITPEGRTMVPMRIAAESFNAWTIWNGEEGTIGVEAPEYRIDMKLGSTELVREIVLFVDGDEETFTLDVAPQILGGRTMVPLRALSEAMEKTVFWDGETGLIIISEEEIELTRDELTSLSAILG